MNVPTGNQISAIYGGGQSPLYCVPYSCQSGCISACKRMSNYSNTTSRPNLTQQQKAKILLFMLSRYISKRPQPDGGGYTYG